MEIFLRRTKRFEFPFRRLLHCKTCSKCLIGSERKGLIYYRCQTIDCPTTSIREDAVDAQIRDLLRRITLSETEIELIARDLCALDAEDVQLRQARVNALTEALATITARSAKLTDLFIDGHVDQATYDGKHALMLTQRQRAAQELASLQDDSVRLADRVKQVPGLVRRPETLYETADVPRKRHLLQIVTSDCVVTGKSIEFSMLEPFASIALRSEEQPGRPGCYTPRTLSAKLLLSMVPEFTPALTAALEELGTDKYPPK